MTKEMTRQINTLVQQLQELRELHEQLLLTAHGKQRTMRTGDMSGLDSWSARERFLIDRIKQVDEIRRQDTAVMAKLLGFDEDVTMTVLAEHLDEPERSRLLALAGAIRSTAEHIYQVNQVNDAVTREILNCFAQMQRQITATHCDIGLYDPSGHKRMSNHINILDAVG